MRRFKNKNSRRRGIAIELAISLLLIMTAMTTIILTTTMIQVNKQAQSFNDLKEIITEIEKIEYDQIGTYFKQFIQEEFTNIQNETELPTTEAEIHYYKIEKEKELKKELEKYFELYNGKELSFTVSVDAEVIQYDPTSHELGNNNQIIKTTIQKYNYTITYKLNVFKSSVKVFETQNQVTFERIKKIEETKTFKNQDIFNTTYYTYTGDIEGATHSDNIELTIQNDFYILFDYPENVESVEISVINPEDNNVYVSLNSEVKSASFKLVGDVETKDVEILLKYKLDTEDIEKEITIKVTIDKNYSETRLETNITDSYHFSYSKKIGTELVIDESIPTIITTDYEVGNKQISQVIWEYK